MELTCRRIRSRSTGFHAFARVLLPLDTDVALLIKLAEAFAAEIEFYSGHGGLSFVYDAAEQDAALDEIYGRTKRFWGVDIEDLDASIRVLRDHIKGVSWITLVGNPLLGKVAPALASLGTTPGLHVAHHPQGAVIVAGPQPVAGDHNIGGPDLNPYFDIARALEPLFLTQLPDFGGERFPASGQTTAWVRRFLEPASW